MTIRRLPFLAQPGEALLLNTSAIAVAGRLDEFSAATGLDPDQLVASPVLATPIPVYQKGDEGALRRLVGAKPELMWHPLMWLPPASALRYQLRETDDSPELRLETDDEWAIRIALEMVAAGLYDQASGTWLDLLSLHGIDPDNPVDAARIEAWLTGATDPDLDSIDLSVVINPDGEDNPWSLHAAQHLARVLIPAQWSLTAASLLETIEAELPSLADPDEYRRLATAIAGLALGMLEDVPAADDGVATGEAILDVHDQLEDPEGDPHAAMGDLTALLTDIREDYAIAVETLEASEGAAALVG